MAATLRAILFGGLGAGVLDLLDAFVFSYALRGTMPVRILQAIASGLLGSAAFQGGAGIAALGVVIHFSIATTMAAVFVIASRAMPALRRHAVAAGIVYGIGAYFVMNYVVLPLSAVRPGAFAWPGFINGMLIHAFGVGLPIALIARRVLGPARQ